MMVVHNREVEHEDDRFHRVNEEDLLELDYAMYSLMIGEKNVLEESLDNFFRLLMLNSSSTFFSKSIENKNTEQNQSRAFLFKRIRLN